MCMLATFAMINIYGNTMTFVTCDYKRASKELFHTTFTTQDAMKQMWVY